VGVVHTCGCAVLYSGSTVETRRALKRYGSHWIPLAQPPPALVMCASKPADAALSRELPSSKALTTADAICPPFSFSPAFLFFIAWVYSGTSVVVCGTMQVEECESKLWNQGDHFILWARGLKPGAFKLWVSACTAPPPTWSHRNSAASHLLSEMPLAWSTHFPRSRVVTLSRCRLRYGLAVT
jgi:hypothetical protein